LVLAESLCFLFYKTAAKNIPGKGVIHYQGFGSGAGKQAVEFVTNTVAYNPRRLGKHHGRLGGKKVAGLVSEYGQNALF